MKEEFTKRKHHLVLSIPLRSTSIIFILNKVLSGKNCNLQCGTSTYGSIRLVRVELTKGKHHLVLSIPLRSTSIIFILNKVLSGKNYNLQCDTLTYLLGKNSWLHNVNPVEKNHTIRVASQVLDIIRFSGHKSLESFQNYASKLPLEDEVFHRFLSGSVESRIMRELSLIHI